MSKPLTNIRVLDLSRILAAPWAAQILGDWGAEVIKVERPGQGDDSRRFGPPFLKDPNGVETNESAFYLSANRNKRSIAIDISKPAGQELVRRLAAKCDVLIENYKVGDLKRYGLDYESLRVINPRLIYCSVTGFGQTGPYSSRAGYDSVFQAMGGLMSVTGLPDELAGGAPMKTGPSLADILAGQFALSAILTALYQRDANGGTGQHIDIALLDAMIAAMSHYASHYLVSGDVPIRRGTEGNGGMPSRLFRCADQDIVIVCGNDEQFVRLCEVLGRPELARDPKLEKNVLRVKNRHYLAAVFEPIIATWQGAELLAALECVGVPAGPVYNLQQVFADQHVQSRGMVVDLPHDNAEGGKLRIVANPVKFSSMPTTEYRRPPGAGQHTREILADVLGMDDEQIEGLKASGAV